MPQLFNSKNERSFRRQLSWFLFFRVLVLSLFLGGTIVYQLRNGSGRLQTVLPYLYGIVGLTYLQAFLSAILLPRIHRARLFIQTQIVWDLIVSCLLIYLTGGIESPFSFLFIFSILSAAVFLSRREVLFVASASSIIYGSLLDLQFYQFLPLAPGVEFPLQINGTDVFFAVFINVIAFFITALLSVTLLERLRYSEQELEKREIDFEELEDLNRTILANISSGMMIINSQGRIRSFNTAATRITGYSLEEVYNRDVREIFSNFKAFEGGAFTTVRRGEGRFLDRKRVSRTLGYSSTLIRDPQEKTIGLLFTFQDLTALKEMEEQLKRSDRLAAVGRLASGMAHEIRNPLASISGSIQLLMEGQNVTPEDRRLMKIVVKEAERLSKLLTDFLTYARPRPPQKELFNLSQLLDELIRMVSLDPRFSKIDLIKKYPASFMVRADSQQLHQAFWNLMINAADVMPAGGTLSIGLDENADELWLEDSGPGIPEDIRDKIFDPFFTTKEKGSGLGLATVYSIIEAHGGDIDVREGLKGGTRFVIRLSRGK